MLPRSCGGRMEDQLMMRKLIATTALGVLAFSAPAMAQEEMTLKLAHIAPATHYLWEQGAKPFTEAVTESTGGRVRFDVYPAGQLGKDYISILNSGIADVVFFVANYAPDKFPLTSVVELPSPYKTSCEATARFWDLAQDGGLLNEQEYKPQGIHVLFVSSLRPYTVMTTGKQVAGLGDVAGLKLRANGAAMDKAVRALGGVPVRVPSPEAYDALTRGTVDGGVYSYLSLPEFKLDQVFHHAVDGVQIGSPGIVFAMSERGWERLPEDVKAAMTEAALPAQEGLCAWQDAEETKVRDRLVAEQGFTVNTLSAEEAAQWNERLATVASVWLDELKAVGKDGEALLQAYMGEQPTN
ncbi:hypothetical protein DVR11_07870 [Paracoccus versutus]|nr:hypothetical protein DVR11_07870 [Paracoccus versutus]